MGNLGEYLNLYTNVLKFQIRNRTINAIIEQLNYLYALSSKIESIQMIL